MWPWTSGASRAGDFAIVVDALAPPHRVSCCPAERQTKSRDNMDRVALVGRQFRPFIEDVDDVLPDLICVQPMSDESPE
jgi:hypothetical protein